MTDYHHWNRRTMLGAAAASIAAVGLRGCTLPEKGFDGSARLRALEMESGGILGAAILDTASGQMLGNRLDERFAHCSSFKLSLAAMALRAGDAVLDTKVSIADSDITTYSPVTQPLVGRSMTIRELAKAALVASDNAAANLVLRQLGGPGALTGFWRSIGDDVSRLDRTEPSLNYVPPGEVRDTTTARAMAQTVGNLLFGDALDGPQRTILRGWMRETQTGMNRVRGGIPSGWDSGDKTGTAFAQGMGSIYVDLAFAVPPGGESVIIAGYFKVAEVHSKVEPDSAAVLAALGAIAATWVRPV
ncbi:class A beta-lactamase [Altererythrobacter aquiaggeris]|uniref:class A beta-lactamase n=1 Tax=Aestuarierythrobacter aquiaggeris TaxID=1898396 RepID=UPI003017067E